MLPSLYTIKGILILNAHDGTRILAKYYNNENELQSVKEQKEFEKELYQKTHKANSEIIMLDGLTVVYRMSVDLYFYVIGSINENELMLMNFLNCFYDTINIVCTATQRNSSYHGSGAGGALSSSRSSIVEKKYLLQNLDSVYLICDELCDQGIILDNDAIKIAQRVSVKNDDGMGLPLSEQTVVDVLRAILK